MEVGYIIKAQDNKFKGFVAIAVPDGDDSSLFVIGSTKKSENLEEIQELVKQLPEGVQKFLNPIESSATGISWLSELKAANPPAENTQPENNTNDESR